MQECQKYLLERGSWNEFVLIKYLFWGSERLKFQGRSVKRMRAKRRRHVGDNMDRGLLAGVWVFLVGGWNNNKLIWTVSTLFSCSTNNKLRCCWNRESTLRSNTAIPSFYAFHKCCKSSRKDCKHRRNWRIFEVTSSWQERRRWEDTKTCKKNLTTQTGSSMHSQLQL